MNPFDHRTSLSSSWRVFADLASRLVFCAALLTAAGAAGQGGVLFSTRVPGQVGAPVFGPELADPTLPLQGNPSDGYPVGSQAYTGALLSGTNYTAELWAGPEGAQECQLVAVSRTVFRTGTEAGFVQPPAAPVIIPGVAAGARAMLQLRAWDNRGGSVASWAQAECAPAARGSSGVFLSDPLAPSDGQVFLRGLQSFNIFDSLTLPYHILVNLGGCDLEFAPTVFEGENVTLTLRCVQPGASLQWRLAGADIPGARSSTLVLPNIRLNQAGVYSVADTLPPGGILEPISVNLRVVPRPRLSSPHLTPGGFAMTVLGVTNRFVAMEQSSNLTSWASWTTQFLFGPAQINYPGPLPRGSRIFRAHPLP